MKTQLLFTLLVLSLPFGALCQLEKGSYMGSASAGLAYQHYKDPSGGSNYTINNFQVMIGNNIGIFVAKQLAIGPGFSIDFGTSTSKFATPSQTQQNWKSTYYDISVDPFIRYYFFHHGKCSVFGQFTASAGYGQQYENETYSNYENKYTRYSTSFGGSLMAGFVYFMTPNIGIETSLGYQFMDSQSKLDGNTDYNTTGSLALNAGFSFYFGKCKTKQKDSEKEEGKQ
jgi:hypothetical protein